jgi:hypothetical protein
MLLTCLLVQLLKYELTYKLANETSYTLQLSEYAYYLYVNVAKYMHLHLITAELFL